MHNRPDASLLDTWLGPLDRLAIYDEAAVAIARDQVRRVGRQAGMDDVTCEAMAVVASELGYNQLRHAGGGYLALQMISRGGVPGLEVIAADRGPGIADPSRFFSSPPTPSDAGLGAGLGAVYRLSSELDIDIREREGTCIRARKFAAAVAHHRVLGIVGRPIHGEAVSGDHAGIVRQGDVLALALADGVGHGAGARCASAQAIAVWQTMSADGAHPGESLEHCHRELAATRGATMAALRLDQPQQRLQFAAAGDVCIRIWSRHGEQRLRAQPWTLGRAQSRSGAPSFSDAYSHLAPSDVVIVHTDGLRANVALGDLVVDMPPHPVLLAHALLARDGRPNDDSLVIVAA